MTDLSLREWSTILGVLAFTGLLWRGIGYLPVMSSLERALTFILLCLLLVGAVGTYNLDRYDAPASGVVPYAIAVRVMVLVTVAFWPRFVGRTGTWRERWAGIRNH